MKVCKATIFTSPGRLFKKGSWFAKSVTTIYYVLDLGIHKGYIPRPPWIPKSAVWSFAGQSNITSEHDQKCTPVASRCVFRPSEAMCFQKAFQMKNISNCIRAGDGVGQVQISGKLISLPPYQPTPLNSLNAPEPYAELTRPKAYQLSKNPQQRAWCRCCNQCGWTDFKLMGSPFFLAWTLGLTAGVMHKIIARRVEPGANVASGWRQLPMPCAAHWDDACTFLSLEIMHRTACFHP